MKIWIKALPEDDHMHCGLLTSLAMNLAVGAHVGWGVVVSPARDLTLLVSAVSYLVRAVRSYDLGLTKPESLINGDGWIEG